MKRLLLLLPLLLVGLWPSQAAAQADTCRVRQGTTCIVTATDVVPQTTDVTNLGSATKEYLAFYVKNITFGTGGVLKLRDGTAAAPSLTFASETGLGFYRSASNELGFTVSTYSPGPAVQWGSTSQTLGSGYSLAWASGVAATNTADLFVTRDAANTLAQRNGTTAQEFRIYNTFTDASNYERGGIRWGSNLLTLFSEAAGTGTARSLVLGSSNSNLFLATGGANGWKLDSSWILSTQNANALGTTPTDAILLQNTTAATVGMPVQMSPRLRLSATAYNSVSTLSETNFWTIENLPSTAAGATSSQFKLGSSLAGGAVTYPFILTAGGTALLLNSGALQWGVRGYIDAPADAQFNLHNNANSAGIGFDVSTDSTLKVRTRAQTGYGTVDALAYNASGVAGVTGTCDTPTFTGGVATTCNGSGGSVDGNYFVTSNFTTDGASTALNLITGLTWTFPANTAINVPFTCSLVYSQATGVVADSFGIQDVTVAPTNAMFKGQVETAAAVPVYANLTAFASTTATNVVVFTPGATGTTYNAQLDGFIEQPSNASSSVFKIMVKTPTAADVITVYRGSYCKVG